MCKERIEKNLTLTKGIKEAVLDLDTKVVTISYNPKKIKPADIKSVIIKTGYDADDIMADDKAHDKLPECCQKSAEAHGHKH
jgi:copper chaperone CopZ